MKNWIKVLFAVASFFVVVYVVFAAVMVVCLPKRVAVESSRLPVIRNAIAEMVNDQLLLSRRIHVILDQANTGDNGKVDIVYRMLSDVDINRIALKYLGCDFAMHKSSFSGEVKHVRALMRRQKSSSEKERGERDSVKRKIRELESRKSFIYEEIRGYSSRETVAQKLSDIEAKISSLKEQENNMSRNLENVTSKDGYDGSSVQKEKRLFDIACDYEQKTVLALEKAISQRKTVLQEDEQRILLLRDRYDALDIWPFPALRRVLYK